MFLFFQRLHPNQHCASPVVSLLRGGYSSYHRRDEGPELTDLHTRLSRVPTAGRTVLRAPTLLPSLASDGLRRHLSHVKAVPSSAEPASLASDWRDDGLTEVMSMVED